MLPHTPEDRGEEKGLKRETKKGFPHEQNDWKESLTVPTGRAALAGMTSINAPACLLACNHFHRHAAHPGGMKSACLSSCSRPKQKPTTLWVTVSVKQGLGANGRCVRVILNNPSPSCRTSKHLCRSYRAAK
ncbi:hypothetical protein GN956_G5184 [Arapaima gigas]